MNNQIQIPEATQTTLEGVIDFLEHVQKITSDDKATFLKEIESPNPIHNNEASQRHFKMLLGEAIHELDCLEVVIAKLKYELSWEFREVIVEFELPDPGEHVETGSQEYKDYYGINGPHIQLCEHLDDLLRKAGFGYVEEWESDDGHSYYIVTKGNDEVVLKETILKALAENDYGLQDIKVITQTEMEQNDACVAKSIAERDAMPQEEKDCIKKEDGDIEDMLAAIRMRRAELKAAE